MATPTSETATAAEGSGSNSAGGNPTPVPRPRVNNACEACRAAKVKCQSSVQTGICRRCLEFKRECVFRTGPRTRRPRQSRLNHHNVPHLPPPAGPSKTFSINFDMPAPVDASMAAIDSLASRHEAYIENLFPPDDTGHTPMYDDLMFAAMTSFHHPGGIAPTTPASHSSPYSSLSHSHRGASSSSTTSEDSGHAFVSISSIGMKPQFNLDSATKLLTRFKEMLTHFPCILLPPDATVASLASSRPFVLLAILSVASGAEALQGHTLYDDEFRKILGLKFVAGGERSVELLQGLLIYSAWYPFHLRPRNKQAFQYIRMATEIAHDLELVDPPAENLVVGNAVTPEQIEGMRTYLSCYYLVSSFLVTWSKFVLLGVEYTAWTEKCCDVLEQHSDVEGDHVLSWLSRNAHILEETGKIDRNGNSDEAGRQQAKFMLLGLEAQFLKWKDRIPLRLLSNGGSLHIATAFAELYFSVAPLLRFRIAKPGGGTSGGALPFEPTRLKPRLPVLRDLLNSVAFHTESSFINLSSMDWGKIIQATILSIKLSFPLPGYPSWDDTAARGVIKFQDFIERFCRTNNSQDTSQGAASTPSGKTNVYTASAIVFAVVQRKFLARLAKLESPGTVAKGARGCPMLDGTLDNYFPAWDPDLTAPSIGGLGWVTGIGDFATGSSSESNSLPGLENPMETGQALYHDVWASMTTGWTQDDEAMLALNAQPEALSGCPAAHHQGSFTHP